MIVENDLGVADDTGSPVVLGQTQEIAKSHWKGRS